MKKILLLLAVAILVALGLTGLSSAYFSDVETSEGNIITAGTTELQVDGQVEFDFEFDKRTIKRGASGVATIDISNTGTAGGVVELHIMKLLNYENDCKGKHEKRVDKTCGEFEGELGANLLITITYNSTPIVERQPLNEIASINLGYLGAEEPATVVIAWELPGDLGKDVRHIIESDSVSFSIDFSLGW